MINQLERRRRPAQICNQGTRKPIHIQGQDVPVKEAGSNTKSAREASCLDLSKDQQTSLRVQTPGTLEEFADLANIRNAQQRKCVRPQKELAILTGELTKQNHEHGNPTAAAPSPEWGGYQTMG
jgi:hypothetical protein